MAKVGLKGIRYAVLKDDGTYEAPKSIGKGISATVTPSSSEAKLYADDALAESDSTFGSATVSLTVDDDRSDVLGELLGHAVSATTGEIIRNSNDIAPYVGLGRIITKIVNNTRAYKVEFLARVKFKEPNQEDTTKGESVEFSTVTIEGDASTPDNGNWSKSNTFETETEAVAYLTACFGVEG